MKCGLVNGYCDLSLIAGFLWDGWEYKGIMKHRQAPVNEQYCVIYHENDVDNQQLNTCIKYPMNPWLELSGV